MPRTSDKHCHRCSHVHRLIFHQRSKQGHGAQNSVGVEIRRKSLLAPVKQMALNCGDSPDLIVDKIMNNDGCGWDFKNSCLVDMVESGIIDPAKVTRTAMQNSVSAASTLITSANAIVEE